MLSEIIISDVEEKEYKLDEIGLENTSLIFDEYGTYIHAPTGKFEIGNEESEKMIIRDGDYIYLVNTEGDMLVMDEDQYDIIKEIING